MKPETEQIVATIEVLTDGLSCSCVGDEPYGIMAWEVEEKGEFNFFNFLLDVQALTLLNADEFRKSLQQIEFKRAIKEYGELIKLLETHLSQLQIYSYQAPYLSEEHTNYSFPDEIELIIIGSTQDEEWLAFAPLPVLTTEPKRLRFTIPNQKLTEATAKWIESVQVITGYLAQNNRGEKMVLKSQMSVAYNPSNAIEKILDLAGYINICEIDYFWDLETPIETDISYDMKMQEIQLKQFFKQELIDARVYNLHFCAGEYQVHYILGKNKNDDWMGVFTDTYSC